MRAAESNLPQKRADVKGNPRDLQDRQARLLPAKARWRCQTTGSMSCWRRPPRSQVRKETQSHLEGTIGPSKEPLDLLYFGRRGSSLHPQPGLLPSSEKVLREVPRREKPAPETMPVLFIGR
jgi:hypothetical protein